MGKWEKTLMTMGALFPVALILMYVLNPFGTDTGDIRGRILGHVPYVVPSRSMEPTLAHGDTIVAATYVYWRNEPRRNDIIVFHSAGATPLAFVKRVVGVSGDRLRMEDGQLFVNDSPAIEPFAVWHEDSHPRAIRSFEEVKVPEGLVYVLGDNRGDSADSRYWGFVPREKIVGRAELLVPAEGN